MKKQILVWVCLFLLVAAVNAAVGAGVSPADGTYEFNKTGGSFKVAIYNGGDKEMNFAVSISGEAADFARVEQSSSLIPPQGTFFFVIQVSPNLQAQFDKEYTLRLRAVGQPAAVSGGVGAAMVPAANAIYTIVFRNEGTGPVAFQREATSIENPLKGSGPWLTIAVVAAGVIAIALLTRKR